MFRSIITIAAVASFSFAGAFSGCKKSGDETKVTVNSKDDATKSIVDPDYRFELAWPGDGWKLLHEHDAARISPQAIAGAVQQDNVFGVVIVEAAPGVEADPLTDLLIGRMQLAAKKVEVREHVTFVGEKATRIVITGNVGDIPFRYVELVFIHQGFAYQVLGWGTMTSVAADGHQLKPLFDAFKLTEGKVSGRASKPVVDARGPGWRVAHGEFQSGVTGVRTKQPAGWSLLVGESLEQTNADAEVGLEHADPEVYIIAITERAPPAAALATFVAAFRDKIGGKTTGTSTTKIAGHDVELAKILTPGPMGFEYLHGVDVHDDQLTQYLAWYFPGDRARATQILRTGFDAFDYLPRAQATALADELSRAPDTQSAIGAGFALRRGVYTSYAHDWSWTAPRGTWKLGTGDHARMGTTTAELSMVELGHNLYGLVTSEPNTMSATAFHAAAIATMTGANNPSKPVAVQLGEVTGYTSTVDMVLQGEPLRYQMTTVVGGGRAVRLVMWGTPQDLASAADEVDAASRGLRLGHIARSETIGDELVDHRMGFAVRPPIGAKRSGEIPDQTDGLESFTSWTTNGKLEAAVLAAYMPGADEQWSLDFMEQRIRDRIGVSASDITQTEVPFAGTTARKLTLPGFTLYVLIRDQIVYAYLTVGGADGFRLLDPQRGR